MLQKGPGFAAHQLGASRYNLRWGVVLTGVVIEIWVGKEKPCKIAAAGEKSFEEPGEKKKKKKEPITTGSFIRKKYWAREGKENSSAGPQCQANLYQNKTFISDREDD